jgi:membrane protein
MKNLFLSIGWLYFCFAVLILGIEIMSTLNKRQVLMLRGLFMETPPDRVLYYQRLMEVFGKTYQRGEKIFQVGEQSRTMFYILSGQVSIVQNGIRTRTLDEDNYFGEMSFLTGKARTADAFAETDSTQIVIISQENMEMLLLEEPTVSFEFLRQMALRLQESHTSGPS